MTKSKTLRRLARWITAACALSIPALGGCQSLSLPKKLPWSKETVKESEFQTPVRMVVLWSEDVMTQQGQSPARGFGARIYFYNERNQTVSVEGQLVVYGYDDSGSNVSSRSPDRKFVFTAEQFSQHYSKSDLGASYSVWVPWDAVGGVEKEISLIPVFTATSGKIVVGPQGINVLSGSKKGGQSGQVSRGDRRTLPGPDVRSVSHWEIAASQNDPSGEGQATSDFARDAEVMGRPTTPPNDRRRASTMRSSTIYVPESLGRRMAADPAESSLTTESPQTGSPAAAPAMDHSAAPAISPNMTQPIPAPAPARQYPNANGGLPPTAGPLAFDPRLNEQRNNQKRSQDPSAALPNPWQPVQNTGGFNQPPVNDPRWNGRAVNEFPAPTAPPPTNLMSGQPSTHSQSSQFPVPAGPAAQSFRGPDPSAPSPSAWQSQPGLPPGPPNPYSRPGAW